MSNNELSRKEKMRKIASQTIPANCLLEAKVKGKQEEKKGTCEREEK